MDLSAMRARAEELMADFERMRASAGQVRGRLLEVHGRGAAGDGLVRVVADRRGRVESVEIDPRVFRRPDSRELAEMIVAAARQAAADADRQAEEAFDGLLSPEALRAHLDFDIEAVFGRLEEEIGPLAPPDVEQADHAGREETGR